MPALSSYSTSAAKVFVLHSTSFVPAFNGSVQPTTTGPLWTAIAPEAAAEGLSEGRWSGGKMFVIPLTETEWDGQLILVKGTTATYVCPPTRRMLSRGLAIVHKWTKVCQRTRKKPKQWTIHSRCLILVQTKYDTTSHPDKLLLLRPNVVVLSRASAAEAAAAQRAID